MSNETLEKVPKTKTSKKAITKSESKKSDSITKPVTKPKTSKKIITESELLSKLETIEDTIDLVSNTELLNDILEQPDNDTLKQIIKDKVCEKINNYLEYNNLEHTLTNMLEQPDNDTSEISQKFLEIKHKWEQTHKEICEHNIRGEQLEIQRRYYISEMSKILDDNKIKNKSNVIDSINESENNITNHKINYLSDEESNDSETDKTLNLKIKNKIIKKNTSSDSDSD